MNKFLILLISLCVASFAGAAEPAKAVVKAAQGDSRSDADKYAEAKRYLDRLEGTWVGKEILIIPTGESVSTTTETVYQWKEDNGEKVMTGSFSAHTLSGGKVRQEGVMRLSRTGVIEYQGTVRVGDGAAKAVENKQGPLCRMFIRGASFVTITKDTKGETIEFTSEDFAVENGEDVLKEMGFVVIPVEGGKPVKVRMSATKHRKK